MRGGARRLHAKRTLCTLSVQPRTPTKQMGLYRRPGCVVSRVMCILRRVQQKPTLVLLVRHAVTPVTGVKLTARAPGVHLSDDGRRQAEGVATRIGRLTKITAVY